MELLRTLKHLQYGLYRMEEPAKPDSQFSALVRQRILTRETTIQRELPLSAIAAALWNLDLKQRQDLAKHYTPSKSNTTTSNYDLGMSYFRSAAKTNPAQRLIELNAEIESLGANLSADDKLLRRLKIKQSRLQVHVQAITSYFHKANLLGQENTQAETSPKLPIQPEAIKPARFGNFVGKVIDRWSNFVESNNFGARLRSPNLAGVLMLVTTGLVGVEFIAQSQEQASASSPSEIPSAPIEKQTFVKADSATTDLPKLVTRQVSEQLADVVQPAIMVMEEPSEEIGFETESKKEVNFTQFINQTITVNRGESLYSIINDMAEKTGQNWKNNNGVTKGHVIAAMLAQADKNLNFLLEGQELNFSSLPTNKLAIIELAFNTEDAADYTKNVMPLFQKHFIR